MKEYEYLGIMLLNKSLFREILTGLAKEANKALFSLMKNLSNLSYPYPSLMRYLFDPLTIAVMDNGSEICYFAITDSKNSLEI